MEKIVENQRKSNFELLRIFAMVLIILHHYALHGGLIYINRFVVNKYMKIAASQNYVDHSFNEGGI